MSRVSQTYGPDHTTLLYLQTLHSFWLPRINRKTYRTHQRFLNEHYRSLERVRQISSNMVRKELVPQI
ncbi:hypothetical protein L596_023701 [Steinernema carpocapsae]|uniref:Uncharacterized protein n=1 Tax=Steinernema carpocapsae TaxID=34508 RepID=A0A4U5MEG3_STECR|nr:hypothetical protein L596_023701 [Steinernema carpocapsae]